MVVMVGVNFQRFDGNQWIVYSYCHTVQRKGEVFGPVMKAH